MSRKLARLPLLARLYLLVEPGRLHWEREDRPDWWPVHAVSVPNHEFTVALKELMGIPSGLVIAVSVP